MCGVSWETFSFTDSPKSDTLPVPRFSHLMDPYETHSYPCSCCIAVRADHHMRDVSDACCVAGQSLQ